MSNTLRDAVYSQLSSESEEDFLQSCRDIANHGADAGFPGFTYYSDTCDFYDKLEKEIWELLEEEMQAMGCDDVAKFIASFNTSADSLLTFKNLLAWFTLETIARQESE